MTGQRVLLVEDNPDDEALAIRALEKNGISDVVIARDGEEALDYLFGTGENDKSGANAYPRLVLLDLKLPKVDGLEVLKRLRADKRTQHLPVVLLTSSNEQRDVVAGYNNGVNSYVRKPVDFNGFMETVRQLGQYWLGLNVVPHA